MISVTNVTFMIVYFCYLYVQQLRTIVRAKRTSPYQVDSEKENGLLLKGSW